MADPIGPIYQRLDNISGLSSRIETTLSTFKEDPLSFLQPFFVGAGQAFGLVGHGNRQDRPLCPAARRAVCSAIFCIPIAAYTKIPFEEFIRPRWTRWAENEWREGIGSEE